MSYDVGEAYLQIVPNFNGVVEKISAEAAKWGTTSGKSYADAFNRQAKGIAPTIGPSAAESAKQGATSGGLFADTFKAKVTAALKSLPPLEIGAATTEAEQKIRDLKADLATLANQRVGVDISDTEAVAKLDELRARLFEVGNNSTSARVQVDTLAALAKLEEFQTEMRRINGETAHARVKVDVDGAPASVAAAATASAGGDAADAGSGVSGLFGMMTAVIGLGPALIPVGATAVGIIAGIGSAAVGAAAGVGVLTLAFSGVSNAVKLLGQLQTAEAADSQAAAQRRAAQGAAERAAASQLVSAQASLANARRSAANAAISADEQVSNAARSVADAQRSAGQQAVASAEQVKNAEQSLADAERAAAEQRRAAAESVANAKRSLADAQRQQVEQAITSAEQIAHAEQSLQDVEESVAQGRIQAARQVANAEQGLTQANRQAADAQKALNDAREQATRDLEDSANRQIDAQLAAQQASLDYAQQQGSTAKILGSSTATEFQKEQAVLSLAEAHQRLSEAQQNAQRTTIDNAAAQMAGVDGNKGVVSAQQQVTNAAQAQQQAQQNLADAVAAQQKQQIDGLKQITAAEQNLADAQRSARNAAISSAEQVANAQRGLTDALRSQRQQAQQSAEAVAKAEQAVTDALRSQQQQAASSAESIRRAEQGLADAERSRSQQQASSAASVAAAQRGVKSAMDAVAKAAAGSGTAGQSALAKIKAELAQVNPDVLAFAKYWRDEVTPQFKNLQDAAAKGLLPGVTQFFKDIKPLMPGLAKFVGDVASAMGDLFVQAGKALQAPFWTQFFAFLDKTVGPNIKTLGTAFGYIAEGLAALFQAIAPVSAQALSGFLTFAEKFAEWAMNLANNKGFQAFLKYVIDSAPKVMGLLGDIFVIVGKLVDALAPFGGVLLDIIKKVADFLAKLSPRQLMAIVGAIGALAAVLGAPVIGLAVVVVWAATELVNLWTHSKTFRDFVEDHLIPTLKTLWEKFKNEVIPVLHDLWDKLKSDVIPILKDLWAFVRDHLVPVVGKILHDALTGVHDAIRDVGKAVDDHKPQLVELKNAFRDIVNFITDHVLPLLGPILKGVFKTLGSIISGGITITADLTTAWSDLFTGIKKVFDWIRNTLVPHLKTAWHDMSKDASAFVDDLGSIWQGIMGLFSKPVKWVIETVLNDGILKAWNWVVDHIGMKSLDVPLLTVDLDPPRNGPAATGHRLATGGVIPGYAPGVDSVPAMLSPGEGVLRPEVVRALGEGTIHAWNRAAMSGGMPHFASGGIFGSIGNIASSAWHGITDAAGAAWGAAKDVAGLLKDPLKWLAAHLTAPLNALSAITSSDFGKVVAGVPRGIESHLVDKLKGLIGFGGGSGSASAPGGGAMAYAGVVRQVLAMLGLKLSDVNGVLSLIDHESSGNPDNVNRWDSNWLAGHPSVGLMQVIRGTFDAYAGPFRNTGPFQYGVSTDPLANIYAGVNYALHRYGEGMLAAGGRHDAAGNYIGYDNGGYLPTGISQVVNGTGKPERILTDQQWATLRDRGSSVAVLAPEDAALLHAIAGRPVSVQIRQREVAEAVNDYRQDRIAHGERGW